MIPMVLIGNLITGELLLFMSLGSICISLFLAYVLCGALVRVAGHGFARRAALLGYLACRFNRSAAAAARRGGGALHRACARRGRRWRRAHAECAAAHGRRR